jgi:hypothetical protein
MGSAQLIMLIGGLLLLTVLSMNFYSSFRGKSDTEVYNESLITGTGLGQSLIDEISTRAFDAKTVTKNCTQADSLTSPGALGPEAGESSSTQFNDVDDYKNFVRLDTMVMGVFRTRVNVNYTSKMSPNTISATRTFTKRIDVYITNTYLVDTLKMNYIISY